MNCVSFDLFSSPTSYRSLCEGTWKCEPVRYDDSRLIELLNGSLGSSDLPSIMNTSRSSKLHCDKYILKTSKLLPNGIKQLFNKIISAYQLIERSSRPHEDVTNLLKILRFLRAIVIDAIKMNNVSLLIQTRKELIFLLRSIGSSLESDSSKVLHFKENAELHGQLFVWRYATDLLYSINEVQPVETTKHFNQVSRTFILTLIEFFNSAGGMFPCQCLLEMSLGLIKLDVLAVTQELDQPVDVTTLDFVEKDYTANVSHISVFQFLTTLEEAYLKIRGKAQHEDFTSPVFHNIIEIVVSKWNESSTLFVPTLSSLLIRGCGKALLDKPSFRIKSLLNLLLGSIFSGNINEFDPEETDWERITVSTNTQLSTIALYIQLFALLISNDAIGRNVVNNIRAYVTAKTFGGDQPDAKVLRTCVFLRIWLKHIKEPIRALSKIVEWLKIAITPASEESTNKPNMMMKSINMTEYQHGSGNFQIIKKTMPVLVNDNRESPPQKCAVSQDRLTLLLRFVGHVRSIIQGNCIEGMPQLIELRAFMRSFVDSKKINRTFLDELVEDLREVDSPEFEVLIDKLPDQQFAELCRKLSGLDHKVSERIINRAEMLARKDSKLDYVRHMQDFVITQAKIELRSRNFKIIDRLLRYNLDKNFPIDSLYALKTLRNILDFLDDQRKDNLAIPLWIRCVFEDPQKTSSQGDAMSISDVLVDFILSSLLPSSNTLQIEAVNTYMLALLRIPEILATWSELDFISVEKHLDVWFQEAVLISAKKACLTENSLFAAYFMVTIMNKCGAILYRLAKRPKCSFNQSLHCQFMTNVQKFLKADVVKEDFAVSIQDITILYLQSFLKCPVETNDKFYLCRYKDLILHCFEMSSLRDFIRLELSIDQRYKELSEMVSCSPQEKTILTQMVL